jgi:hypothetical protein
MKRRVKLIRFFALVRYWRKHGSTVRKVQDNIDTIKKNTETLIGPSKEVGLEVHAEKTEYNFQILRKYGTVPIFGNDSNKSKFVSGGN